MATKARTVAEATVWTINENGLDTSEALTLCLTRCEDSTNEEDGVIAFRFEDDSVATFDKETEAFAHDLEF